MGKKTDFATVEKRVTDVFNLILVGADRADILQYASKNQWDVTARSVDEYIHRAREKFIELSTSRRDEELGKAVTRLNKLYQNSLKIQDYKGCLAVQKEINSLLGLYAPTHIRVDDWRSQAIADIKAGVITYSALAAQDVSLADELFALAGLPTKVTGDNG